MVQEIFSGVILVVANILHYKVHVHKYKTYILVNSIIL